MAGFTLMEMLVVLSIIGLIAVVAVRGFVQPSALRARSDRAELVRLLSDARTQALLSGRVVTLMAKDLPPDMRIEAITADSLQWYPDGSASAAKIIRDGRVLVSVDAVTGVVTEIR